MTAWLKHHYKIVLLVILALAFFVRTYRAAELMGFYYDEGRDALAVWDLLHHGKYFLIGPTTGIEGIFLGPFYYYLIAPFYFIGNGNPVFPAVWLVFINICAMAVIFMVGKKFFNLGAGLLAVILVAFSSNLAHAHRWLSNPTPLPLFAALAVWSLLNIIHSDKRWWWLLGLSIGLGLQLEAASAVFFIPATVLILLINRKFIRFGKYSWLIGLAAFGSTLLPQLLFDFRHDHILLKGFSNFLIGQKSFQVAVTGFFTTRLDFYFHVFTDKFYSTFPTALLFSITLVSLLIFVYRKLPHRPVTALLIWCFLPPAVLLFYHGNHGYVWDYYFTGIFNSWALLVAAVFIYGYKYFRWSRGVVILLIGIFLYQNFGSLFNWLSHPDPKYISLKSTTAAVDWIYQDASGRPFNIDAYVPPMIPYSYNYLFLWRGATKFHTQPTPQLLTLLYLVYEYDYEMPGRLEYWLSRQATIGSIEQSQVFGSVTSQRRHRFTK
jgi:4-amino-4-deoxy-L-arabinose transferase-like glycosyltransferase